MCSCSSTDTRSLILYPEASKVTATAAAMTTAIENVKTGMSHQGGLDLSATVMSAAKTSQRIRQAPVGPSAAKRSNYGRHLLRDKTPKD